MGDKICKKFFGRDEECVDTPSWAEGIKFTPENANFGYNYTSVLILGKSIYLKTESEDDWIFNHSDLSTFTEVSFSTLDGYTEGEVV